MNWLKILVVFTGGTIGSSIENGMADVDQNSAKILLDIYPDIDFECCEPFAILSENSTVDTLEMLCNFMLSIDYENYDGVIVTHGSDTLGYTAAALGILLSWVKIPVRLTAAYYVLSMEKSNGRANFCGCVDFIREFSDGRHKFAGVYAVWKNSGECVSVHHALSLEQADYNDKFSSFGRECFGTVRDGRFVKNCKAPDRVVCSLFAESLKGKTAIRLSRSVLKLQSYVGEDFESVMISGKDAVLVETYHSGTLCTAGQNTSFAEFAKRCAENGTDVYVFPLKKRDYMYKSTQQISWDIVKPVFDMGACAAFVGLLFRYGDYCV